jgi:hypothetical protein
MSLRGYFLVFAFFGDGECRGDSRATDPGCTHGTVHATHKPTVLDILYRASAERIVELVLSSLSSWFRYVFALL